MTPLLTDGGLPLGAEKDRQVRAMFDTIAPRYEVMNRIVTFGLDAKWRTEALRSLALPAGSTVIDVATGTGDFIRGAAREGWSAIGVDLSMGMLEAGAMEALGAQGDAAALPIASGVADGVVCGYGLRNFSDLDGAFAEMARVLRPGGRVALLEVASPRGALTRAGFSIWFNKVVPLLGAALSDAAAYRYLPRSVAYLPPPDELRARVAAAGFSGVNHRLLWGGLSQLLTATRIGAH